MTLTNTAQCKDSGRRISPLGIRVGNGFKGVKAPHGQNFLEINSHTDGIYQMISTEKGKMYTVEFDVRSRGKNFDSDDEAVYPLWNEQVPNDQGYRAQKFGEWTTVSAIVLGTGADKLTFRESAAAADRTGPFIDSTNTFFPSTAPRSAWIRIPTIIAKTI